MRSGKEEQLDDQLTEEQKLQHVAVTGDEIPRIQEPEQPGPNPLLSAMVQKNYDQQAIFEAVNAIRGQLANIDRLLPPGHEGLRAHRRRRPEDPPCCHWEPSAMNLLRKPQLDRTAAAEVAVASSAAVLAPGRASPLPEDRPCGDEAP